MNDNWCSMPQPIKNQSLYATFISIWNSMFLVLSHICITNNNFWILLIWEFQKTQGVFQKKTFIQDVYGISHPAFTWTSLDCLPPGVVAISEDFPPQINPAKGMQDIFCHHEFCRQIPRGYMIQQTIHHKKDGSNSWVVWPANVYLILPVHWKLLAME